MKCMVCTMLAVVGALAGFGRTCTWTGAENGFWTNANNWAEGAVPGIYVQPDGTYEAGEETQDIAVFGPVAAGATTVINLAGHRCVSNLLITAGAPAYTFGTSASQQLGVCIPNGELVMQAGVTADQTFVCKSWLGFWDTTIGSQRAQGKFFNVRNQGTGLMDFQGGFAYNYNIQLRFYGTGNVRVNGNYSNSLCPNNYMDGIFICQYAANGGANCAFKSFPSQVGGSTTLRRYCVPDATSHLVVYDWGSPYTANFYENTQIYGDGTFTVFNSHPNESNPWSETKYGAGVSIPSGKTLTVSTRMVIKTERQPMIYAFFSGSGVFNPQNCIDGKHSQFRISAGTLQVPKIGNLGCALSDTCVGTNVSSIVFVDAGKLVYDGAGETTDRGFGFKVAKTGTVRNAGTGALTLAGAVTSAVNNATLKLDASTAPIVFAGTVDKTVHTTKLAVTGTAGVTLNAAAGDFSAVSLEGGALAVSENVSLPALTLTSGASTLTVGANQTVTLAGLTVSAGTLDIVTADATAKVTVTGRTAGDAPAQVTINGRPAQFANDGTVEKRTVAVHTDIPAYGGRIPNDASKNVGITSTGNVEDGPVKLASGTAAAVAALAQKTSVDATVDLAAGETLTAGKLFVAEDAKSLTIGSAVGQGTLAAASGTFTLWPEGVDSLLTIAATPSLGASTSIEKVGLGVARFTGPFAYAKNITLQEGTLAANIAADTTQNFTLVGEGRFMKEGAGKLTVGTGKNTSFQGDYVVAEGVVAPASTAVTTLFGAETAGSLVVSNGAALHTHETEIGNLNFGAKKIRLAGKGPDGKGALAFNTTTVKDTSMTIKKLALDDDATIGVESVGWNIMLLTELFDMGGHALTRSGSHRLYFQGSSQASGVPCVITNAGPIYLEGPADNGGSGDKNNFLCFINRVEFPGSEPTIYATNANSRIIVQNCGPIPCPIVVSNTLLQVGSFAVDFDWNKNCFTGPFTLAGADSTLYFCGYGDGKRLVTFKGDITGEGGLKMEAGNLFLTGTNTYTGETAYIGAGGSGSFSRLTLAEPESLPAASTFRHVSGYGSINVCVKPDRTGWTDAKIGELVNRLQFNDNVMMVGVDMTWAGDYEIRTANLPPVVSDSKYHGIGAGAISSKGTTNVFTLAVDQDWGNGMTTLGTRNGHMKITGGGGTLTGAGFLISSDHSASTSIVEVCENANVVLHNSSTLGCNDNATAYLKVRDAVIRSAQGTRYINFGSCTLAVGVLELGPGGLIENIAVYPGSADGGRGGAIYQDGGTFLASSGYSYIGNASGAFWNLNSGLAEFKDSAGMLGPTYTNAHALVHQTGGTLSIHGVCALRGGRGASHMHYLQTGGIVDIACTNSTDGLAFPDYSTSSPAYTNGQGVVTVAGEGARFTVTNNLRVVLGNQKNGLGVINLNGGVFAAGLVAANPNGFAGAQAFLNFNGGTLKVNKDTAAFATGDALTCILGPEGGTVDTDGHSVALGKPLVKAATGVVSAIPFGPISGIMVPYAVRIVGDGAGATAVVNYDRATKTMTGITVTSGGTGYTWAKAYIDSGASRLSCRTRYEVDCTISAPAATCGTFRKTGAGTLTLGAGALPAGTPLDVAGGTLDLNGLDVAQLGGITASGCGTIANTAGALTLPATYTVDVPAAVAGAYLTVSGANVTLPTTIALKDVDKVPADTKSFAILKVSGSAAPSAVPAISGELPAGWELYWLGNTLKLGKPQGMTIYFK